MGHPDAALLLADWAKSTGERKLAEEYYRDAIRRKKVKGYSSLAYLLIAQDRLTEAREMFERGAAAGDAVSLYNVGRWYRDGKVVAKDYAKARHYFREAERRGLTVPFGDWQRLREP